MCVQCEQLRHARRRETHLCTSYCEVRGNRHRCHHHSIRTYFYIYITNHRTLHQIKNYDYLFIEMATFFSGSVLFFLASKSVADFCWLFSCHSAKVCTWLEFMQVAVVLCVCVGVTQSLICVENGDKVIMKIDYMPHFVCFFFDARSTFSATQYWRPTNFNGHRRTWRFKCYSEMSSIRESAAFNSLETVKTRN